MARPRKDLPIPIDELKTCYESGETLKELSDRFHCSQEFLRDALHTAGARMRPRGYPQGKHLPSGGRIRDKDGYILVKSPDHPHANSGGYVREHRLVMEGVLGRYLDPQEVVHHDGVPKDCNDPERLRVYPSQAEHRRDEMLGNQYSRKPHQTPPYRHWTSEEILSYIRNRFAQVNRPIRRSDLMPPGPSYRTVNRCFGDWRNAIEQATGKRPE